MLQELMPSHPVSGTAAALADIGPRLTVQPENGNR